MPIFVTGACGFVGLALAGHLFRRGKHAVGSDLQLPPGAIFKVNLGGVIAALVAAVAAVVYGVYGVYSVGRVLHVSSGLVYGASGEHAQALLEDRMPLHPKSLYGIPKQAAETAALRSAALLERPQLPHQVYSVATGFVGTRHHWCAHSEALQSGLVWRVAQPANGDCDAAHDRAPMAIDRLRADTSFVAGFVPGFVPGFDLAAATTDLLAWHSRHVATPLTSTCQHA